MSPIQDQPQTTSAAPSPAPASASNVAAAPGAGTSNWLARIACISTTRADAGIYAPLLDGLAGRDEWTVSLLAGGTHRSAAHGNTIDDIEVPAGAALVPVDHFIPGDDAIAVACCTGAAVGAFAEAITRCRADLVFVLGDRAEMLAAALAATLCGTVIAHLHGGDVTRGAYDDTCRNAITKLAHLHFPALPEHAARLVAMGEHPARILPVGALAVDALARFRPLHRGELAHLVPADDPRPVLVFVFHPQTRCAMPPAQQIAESLAGIEPWPGPVVLIGPNADVGHGAVADALAAFADRRPDACLVPSLPQREFWSILAVAAVLVGNSSAGLLEAPSLRLPAVNIGERQAGRHRAANVIDTPCERGAIAGAIAAAMSRPFRERAAASINPYGDGLAAQRICAALDRLPPREQLLAK